ncbi:MAG: thioredoxin family protein [Chitinophagales bacterium]
MLFISMYYPRISSLLINVTFLLCISFSALAAKGINFFQGSWEEASLLAIKLNKPLFVEAYNEDCRLCKQIEERTFSQEEVGSFYNHNFINLKINIDKEDGVSFRSKYNVQTLPDLIFLAPTGYPIYRDLGDKDKGQLLTLAHKVMKTNIGDNQSNPPSASKTMLETMKEQYDRGFQNINFLYDYAYELKKHNEPYAEIVNIFIAQLKKDKLKDPKNLLFIYDFSNNLQTDAMMVLLKSRDVFEAKYGYGHIVNRIKSTVLTNAKIAGERRSLKLFRETKQIIEKAKLSDEERMIFLVESTFYEKMSSWSEYIEVVKKYIWKHGVRHPVFLQEKADHILAYSENKEDLYLAKKWMETALVQERTYKHYNTYAHILFELGYLIKSKNVAAKALEYANAENNEGFTAKLLIDQIQNYTSKTTTSFNRPIKL